MTDRFSQLRIGSKLKVITATGTNRVGKVVYIDNDKVLLEYIKTDKDKGIYKESFIRHNINRKAMILSI